MWSELEKMNSSLFKRIKKNCTLRDDKGICHGFKIATRKYLCKCKLKNCPRIRITMRRLNAS